MKQIRYTIHCMKDKEIDEMKRCLFRQPEQARAYCLNCLNFIWCKAYAERKIARVEISVDVTEVVE